MTAGGIGRQVVALVAEHVRAQGATVLRVSAHDGDGSPAPFHLSPGFVPTGEMAGDDEPVYVLAL